MGSSVTVCGTGPFQTGNDSYSPFILFRQPSGPLGAVRVRTTDALGRDWCRAVPDFGRIYIRENVISHWADSIVMNEDSHRLWDILQVGSGLLLFLGLLAVSVGLGVSQSGIVSMVLLTVCASLLIVAGISRNLFSNRIIKPRHYSGVAQIFLGVGFLSLLMSPPPDNVVLFSVPTALGGLIFLAYGLATLYRPTWVNAPEDNQSSQKQIQ